MMRHPIASSFALVFLTLGTAPAQSPAPGGTPSKEPTIESVPPDDARASNPRADQLRIVATFVVRGNSVVRRDKSGHVEGKFSVDPVRDAFVIHPSQNCKFPQQKLDLGEGHLSAAGSPALMIQKTHNSRALPPAQLSEDAISLPYTAEGCHGFLGISCGWGYINLDYNVVEDCAAELTTKSDSRPVTDRELAEGVTVGHPDCRERKCYVSEFFWKVAVMRGDRTVCLGIFGEPPVGSCEISPNKDRASLTVKVKA